MAEIGQKRAGEHVGNVMNKAELGQNYSGGWRRAKGERQTTFIQNPQKKTNAYLLEIHF